MGSVHKINSRISSLIAAQEAVPHRQALKRLHEYHNLREELVAVEGAHSALVEKVEQRKEKAREDAKAEMRGQMVARHAGTPRRGRPGSRERRSPKATSRVAADAVQVLEHDEIAQATCVVFRPSASEPSAHAAPASRYDNGTLQNH